MQLRTEIQIDAPPERVWSVLTDFEHYHEWNPFITSMSGRLEVGSVIDIAMNPPESREYRFNATLLTCEDSRELRWCGKMGAEFLFRGEHFFRLSDTKEGQTRFVHGEDFTGLLVRWLGRQLTHTARGFVFMNQALKRRVEALYGNPG
jgi:hypothetical protein